MYSILHIVNFADGWVYSVQAKLDLCIYRAGPLCTAGFQYIDIESRAVCPEKLNK
jgi:hypothetical protein